ncbi:hypothetical protein IAR55_006239 [Kwoniella newhampshirensis]|uniref:DUF4211 domain-containing protein n=1 Tax=Kwoniella newhampshirensis TaxID=1651941 RepID=A0AAW0YFZ9_9TREE
MPSRQTTLFSHFDPVDDTAPGPSRPRPTQSRAPLFQHRSDSDSEGSDGMANIKLSPRKRMVVELPMSARRSLKRTVYDSDNEEEEEEEEIEDVDSRKRSSRRRPSPEKAKNAQDCQFRRLRRDEGDATDEDADEISISLNESTRDRTSPDYDAKSRSSITTARDIRKALEEERKQRVEDDKVDEEITTFPSPKATARRTGNRSPSIVPVTSTEGRISRRTLRNTQTDDEIIAIPTPPTSQYPKQVMTTARRQRPTKTSTRPRPLAFRRTPSVVEVEIRSMSPADLSAYKVWTLEDFKPAPSAERPVERTVSAQAAKSRLDPITEDVVPQGHGDIVLSDDDLAIVTDKDENDRQMERVTSAHSNKAKQPASSSVEVIIPSKCKGKKRQRPKVVSSSEGEDSEPIIAKPRTKPIARSRLPAEKSTARDRQGKNRKQGKLKKKKKIRDPDAAGADTEDEEDVLEDLKMDEPERFKSKTRLREKKETAFQRKIRKLKNQRLGIVESSSESSDSGASGKTYTSDSAPHSIGSSGSGEFIVEDDGKAGQVQLPHMFSLDSAQTPEFKFKVVFHYLVLLVVKGPSILPLKGANADYFMPQLQDLRRRMEGYNNFRVRSQVWRSNLVAALQKYPNFEVEELDFPEPGCDACHMGGRLSKFRVSLTGYPYDRDRHEPLVSSSEEESSDSQSSAASSIKPTKLPRSLLMARAEVFHEISHWEDRIHFRIRKHYRDLLRAKYKPVPSDSELSSSEDDPESDPEEVRERKQDREKRRAATQARLVRLKQKPLPENHKDVDQVTDWMDRIGLQNREFRWLEDLVERSGRLEHDRSTD